MSSPFLSNEMTTGELTCCRNIRWTSFWPEREGQRLTRPAVRADPALAASVNNLLAAGLGKSALGRRSAAWKLWLAFPADKPGIGESDFSDTNCALFTAFMFQRRKSNGSTYETTTITSYISGIRAVIAESVGGEPSRTGHMSAQMLRGCINLRPKKSRVRKPVTVEMLGELLPSFDLRQTIDRSTWVIITTAVHGLCRLGDPQRTKASFIHAGRTTP